ncbi:metal ABC transporter substrate-binding protein [Clostridium aminobutyricum]|uniref:Zinc ABC transporter substrate-binding protein n=1 Tax=Clostridium aminobutyricum TaxID=33953 RepID=A0A939IIT7_CLOAM|nr:metal ABC transporter substrate-binding protein [Clostridium aminobutyricum]MBN7773411.1 zinc ABC transporter substrate-binding protein [Clostridium aminobutyricum]
MRKIFTVIAAMALFVVLITGCGTQKEEAVNKKTTEPLSIVATIFPPYDFTSQIVGDKANVYQLLPPGAESHSYEPTPQDIIKIQNCDVFIYVGGESDTWVDKILESMDTSNMKIIKMMDCVSTVEEEVVEGMQEEEEHDHDGDTEVREDSEEEPEYDEHVWTSPANAMKITQAISDTLCQVDQQNKEYYQQNTKDYIAQLENLDKEFKQIVDQASRKVIVFGDRFPLRYFADEYGLEYYAAFPGCSTETEPSVNTIKYLVDKVKAEKIPVVFYIEFSNHKTADSICEATGAKALLFQSCHNVSQEDLKAGKTYVDLMTENAANLKEALQ